VNKRDSLLIRPRFRVVKSRFEREKGLKYRKRFQ
jgi:hypothetical protein